MTPRSDRPAGGSPLHAVVAGERGPDVVLVHGFTQTLASWAPVAADLARDHVVTSVDAPGHGGSSALRADLAAGATALGATGGRAVYVGYSMGGRLALRLALDRPDLVAGLVLLGATAGIDDPAERAARRRADDALAQQLEQEGVEPFLARWLAQPLFAGLEPTTADLAARLANDPAALASSLRLAGTGTMDPPWWAELGAVSAPTLVLAGAEDPKFTALALRLAEGIGPGARQASVTGAGHAAHLQDPVAVAVVVRRFVATLSDRAPGADGG
ncbi:MAG TPA: alpha/beta fold hydrolase [Aquihabitans sp.]|nr:alpha/beta fold hydrolase [Aquihabitans sp.]